MRIIAECTFGIDGKTYEYLIDSATVLPRINGEEYLPRPGHQPTNLIGLNWKRDGENGESEVPHVDPKDIKPLRIQRIKPYEEKEYPGELKRITHILYLG